MTGQHRAPRNSPALRRYMWPGLPWNRGQRDPATPPPTPEQQRWTVRDEPRTRAEFAAPHPGDFPGGLPTPPEYPS